MECAAYHSADCDVYNAACLRMGEPDKRCGTHAAA